MRQLSKELMLRWPLLAQRKFEKRIKREKKKALKNKRVSSKPLGQYSTSRILDFCFKRIKGKPVFEIHKKTARVNIPKIFSIIDNPDGVLDILCAISEISRYQGIKSIYLDHSKCEVLDMGASICLDILCMEIWKEWMQRNAKRKFEGALPENDKVEYIIRGTGLVKHLKVKGQQLPNELAKKFIYFPLRKGYKPVGVPTRSTAQERAAQDIAFYFDNCLKAKNFRLTENGLKYICNLVGEVIDNAEEHSGHRQWFAVGYMDQSEDVGECQLAIINFGSTMYESLTMPGTPEQLKKDISNLAEKHRKRGFFGFESRWTEENLWTLYALQDGISRWSGTEQGRDRGMGTIKMIEFFQILGDTKSADKHPQMTLVSGSTRILFDSEFHLEAVQVRGETRKLMTFNSSKSLDEKPSAKHVHSLSGFFPGTIISLRFYIDGNYLQSLKGDNHANNQPE